MKNKYTFIIIIALFLGCNFSSLHAQVDYGSRGTDFWLAFGRNLNIDANYISLQIRIVAEDKDATGYLYLTNLNRNIPFSVNANQVFTYVLTVMEVYDVYISAQGVSNRSIHITSDNPVSVYALNQAELTADATNILPAPILGTDYYQISYQPVREESYYSAVFNDAYAVIATENNTQVYHDNTVVATLNRGQVYYRTSTSDMTGAHITANKPIAFFAMSQGSFIPVEYQAPDVLFQQLPPVNTWGKKFFVPATSMKRDRVRILASQDGTKVTLSGVANIITGTGGQSSLNNLHAGEFVELEIAEASGGCYLSANKPVAVCAYLLGCLYVQQFGFNPFFSDPSQCWIAPIEQNVKKALLAPFVPKDPYNAFPQYIHYALIATPTATKTNTLYKTGTSAEQLINGVEWNDHAASGMSFYSMELNNASESYLFSNPAGLAVMGYGVANTVSYYYLLSPAMRILDELFYVNDIHFQEVYEVICEQPTRFRAEINGEGGMSTEEGHLKWYIDGIEEISARDKLEWEKSFLSGVYKIKMEVRMANNTSKERETSITIEKPILTTPENLTLCVGNTVLPISFTGTQVASVSWTVTNGTAIGMTANSGTGNIESFTAINTDSNPLTATITVKPKSAEGCEGEPKTFTITVHPLYDIIYHDKYETPHNNPSSYTIEATPITLSPLSKDGYNFDGWYNSEEELVTEIKKGSTGNLELWAKWTAIIYEISYENTKEVAHQNPADYTIEELPVELEPLTKAGYTFTGWYDNEGLTGENVAEITEGTTGDLVFWAGWELITYTIDYSNLEGAQNTNPSSYTVEDLPLTLAAPTPAEEKPFDGWYNNIACTGSPVTVIEVGTAKSLEFWAKWGSVGIGNREIQNVHVYAYMNTVYIINETNIPLKSVEIMDITGRIVYRSTSVQSPVSLNVAEGQYMVRLMSHDGVLNTKVVIKK
jgi:uncharacterized repeat protein (TIGR02543 family)